MPEYRRWYRDGGTYFFTVKTYKQQSFLCDDAARSALRSAIEQTRTVKPFEIVGWVLLPNHLHSIWRMPENDDDFSSRWSMIKRLFTRQWLKTHLSAKILTARMQHKREPGVWQRRFWEHLIRDQADMANHMNYIHYNPIKHGLVKCPHNWPYSTFHRWVNAGAYRRDWLCSCDNRISGGHGPPYLTFHRWVNAGAYRKDWLCSCDNRLPSLPMLGDEANDWGE